MENQIALPISLKGNYPISVPTFASICVLEPISQFIFNLPLSQG